MNEEFDFSPGMPSEDMAQYLPMYLDETAEQLDALVESLLVLEEHPTDADQLNEAFRLIHSIKGSSGMMGLDGVTVLTHKLENHFERLRSGLQELDQSSMGLILRCIDFLRECNQRLRQGEPLGSAPALLEELGQLTSAEPHAAIAVDKQPSPTKSKSTDSAGAVDAHRPESAEPFASPLVSSAAEREYLITIQFEAGLALADLKAEIIFTRLGEIGTARESWPARADIASVADSRSLQILLATERSASDVRAAVDIDGVELIEIEAGGRGPIPLAPPEPSPPVAVPSSPVHDEPGAPRRTSVIAENVAPRASARGEEDDSAEHAAAPRIVSATEAGDAKSKIVETVRVDIDRLDNLMNLTGELVVKNARFVQIARQMSPAFKKSGVGGRARAFGETVRRALVLMKSHAADDADRRAVNWFEQFHELESEIDALEEQMRLWEESRRGFGEITEAIDQMTRISDGLQRGVLDTRMVPVAPLFNRFKRVVRDIAVELDKKVHLEISGENTELDKRMIDELGDPLVHLVRNAIDHGIEPADVRSRRGKPDAGTISLEAVHTGNNVFIKIRDDGGGIPVDKVRQRIVDRGLASEAVAQGLSEQEVIDYIWNPGFSTAEQVSDISGRGVGMDIVKTRISQLNGTIDIEHALGRGTTFTIRLPLTLAIIRSLLFRVRYGIFAVPIDNVREIVSVPIDQIVTIHGRQTFDVRGEFIPLVDIDDVFEWHSVPYDYEGYSQRVPEAETKRVNVLILHSAEKTMGLKVDEPLGGQDIVIKSLAENFIHIRGLSGASILGDGSVCLLLDVGAAISLAVQSARRQRAGGSRSPLATAGVH